METTKVSSKQTNCLPCLRDGRPQKAVAPRERDSMRLGISYRRVVTPVVSNMLHSENDVSGFADSRDVVNENNKDSHNKQA